MIVSREFNYDFYLLYNELFNKFYENIENIEEDMYSHT